MSDLGVILGLLIMGHKNLGDVPGFWIGFCQTAESDC